MFDNIGTEFFMWWQSGPWQAALAAFLTIVVLVGGVFTFSWLLRFIMRRVRAVR